MDQEQYKTEAEQKLRAADHLLSTTYALVKEPKLLVSVVEHLVQSIDAAIHAVLIHEQLGIKIDGPLEYKLDLYRRKIASKHGNDAGLIEFAMTLHALVEERKKSMVEFKRKEQWIVSDKDFHLQSFNEQDVKNYVKKTKQYVAQLLLLL